MRIAILGAGVTGLTAASILTQEGVHVEVFEAQSQIGGIAKSFDLWGAKVEFGPKFFDLTYFPEIIHELEGLLSSDEYIRYERNTQIYSDGILSAYPPRPLNLIRQLGPSGSIKAGIDLIKHRLFSKENPEKNVSAYVSSKIGGYLFEKYFRSYSEKIWGCPCEEINSHYAKLLIGFNDSYFNKIKQVFSSQKGKGTTSYFFPDAGMGVIWDRLGERITTNGGIFHLGIPLKKIVYDDSGITINPGSPEGGKFDQIISTIPNIFLLKALGMTGAELKRHFAGQRFRNLILAYFKAEVGNAMPQHCLYLYDKTIKGVRLSNFTNFTKTKKTSDGKDILVMEYWLDDNDELWTSSSEEIIVRQLKQDLNHIAGLKEIKPEAFHFHSIKNAYPIPDIKYLDRLAHIEALVNDIPHIKTVGRNSSNAFNFGMDTAMASGIQVAQEILQKDYSRA